MNESCELAINSIQELRNLVDERESEIKSLRTRNAELEAKLESAVDKLSEELLNNDN
jgi:cell division protein ZapA (FtsZ GTPase activity inhibitor)